MESLLEAVYGYSYCHYEGRNALRRIEEQRPELARLGIYDRYAARSGVLHGVVFYEGVLDPDLLRLEVEEVRESIGIARASLNTT